MESRFAINSKRMERFINIIKYVFIGWFNNLTQSFLNTRIPKLLLLAEKDRMDTELTIA